MNVDDSTFLLNVPLWFIIGLPYYVESVNTKYLA